jgi:small subunit ribosomal protein S5
MTETTATKEKVEEKVETASPASTSDSAQATPDKEAIQDRVKAPRVFQKNRRKPNKRRQRVRSEFDQKILDIRRVTRVSAGGRRFSFAVALVAGDKKGRVGVGTGKASDTALAIEKAFRNSKKNLITIKTTADNSIPHEVNAKYNSAKVMMMPAKGRGIIAGSAVRDVIDLSGLKDINAKIISGSKNKLNIARATLKALTTLKDPKPEKERAVSREQEADKDKK